jgi:DNA-binding winged helix-turn-helix (wHTH) protein/TolB-like protein
LDNRKKIGKDLENANDNKNGAFTNGHRYVFGDFEIDPANRICLRGDEQVPMTGRVFDILLVFAENPGRLLKKDELIEEVWRGDFVEDGNLTRNISTLRRALGDDSKEHKYIATVQGHGYRFIADVAEVKPNDDPEVAEETAALSQTNEILKPIGSRHFSRRWIWAIPVASLLFAAVWIVKERSFTPAKQITSLAVLPLKSLDASDHYLGAGIADAVIRRFSQTGQLTVRPTSAVLHYLDKDTDALSAARELSADAVLEGTLQRAGDRLRVSVNLLRTSDGASLWADSFDLPATDIFVMEDKVAQQVATHLRLHLDSARQATMYARYPTSPIAYEFYIKGIFSLDERGYGEAGMPQMETTVDFLKKAIEVDPDYALAHAQLGFAYVWTALFIRPEDPDWANLAKEEIGRSQKLDSNLAETHLANAMLLWSAYEGFQNDAAIRELLLAKQLNPNSGHGELAAIYQHIGLEDLASRELQRALDIDPTSQSLKDLTLFLPYLRGEADEWFSAYQKLFPGGNVGPWYLLRKGRLDDANKVIDERLSRNPENYETLMQQALLLALKGDFRVAEARVPGIIAKIRLNDESRHHSTYDAACIFALAGKSGEAVKWLRETAATGFPNYPLFDRDRYLDRIRPAPEFVQFMADEKAQWEAHRQEFGG